MYSVPVTSSTWNYKRETTCFYKSVKIFFFLLLSVSLYRCLLSVPSRMSQNGKKLSVIEHSTDDTKHF